MGRLPHIPHVDIPRAVLELADLSNVHPAPVFANLDFVVWTDPDRSPRLSQQRLFAWSDDPFTNALPTLGPHAHVDDVAPIIDDLNGATRLGVIPCLSRLPILDLSDRQERRKHQDRHKHPPQFHTLRVHICSSRYHVSWIVVVRHPLFTRLLSFAISDVRVILFGPIPSSR